jgi:hypothetical protein
MLHGHSYTTPEAILNILKANHRTVVDASGMVCIVLKQRGFIYEHLW